jgi:hypothetical protein
MNKSHKSLATKLKEKLTLKHSMSATGEMFLDGKQTITNYQSNKEVTYAEKLRLAEYELHKMILITSLCLKSKKSKASKKLKVYLLNKGTRK